MLRKIVQTLALSAIVLADDKKWVWGDGARNLDREGRYDVYEDDSPYNRPSNPYYEPERPPYRPDLSPINRPDGAYGGTYGPNHPHTAPGVLTGPVPSWVKEGPYKEYDKCKCTEKFNCNSPGISYGHCDVGKQYCCLATKGPIGGPPPNKPIHSIENGVLVGPGGPVDGSGAGLRPAYGGRPGVLVGPGGPVDGGGAGLRPAFGGRPGVLVGPGGPFDRPFGGGGRPGSYGLGRAKN